MHLRLTSYMSLQNVISLSSRTITFRYISRTTGSDVTIVWALQCVPALTDECLVRVNHSFFYSNNGPVTHSADTQVQQHPP